MFLKHQISSIERFVTKDQKYNLILLNQPKYIDLFEQFTTFYGVAAKC